MLRKDCSKYIKSMLSNPSYKTPYVWFSLSAEAPSNRNITWSPSVIPNFLLVTLKRNRWNSYSIIYFIQPNIPKILFHYVINTWCIYIWFCTKSLKPGIYFTLIPHLNSDSHTLALKSHMWLVAIILDSTSLGQELQNYEPQGNLAFSLTL